MTHLFGLALFKGVHGYVKKCNYSAHFKAELNGWLGICLGIVILYFLYEFISVT